MRWCILLLSLLLQLSDSCYCQNDSLRLINGLPTKEVYQILVDKKGFIWIAHELGVSRYDGIKFTSYSHPEQIGLSLFDLLEDEKGRIWCHNLNNQIFYVENEQIFLLRDYKNSGTKFYPRKAMLANEIIINASNGIYVQNTNTLKGKYITKTIEGNTIGPTFSFCTINNQSIIIQAGKNWYLYKQGFGVANLPLINQQLLENKSVMALKSANGDTVYCAEIFKGILYKILYKNNVLKLLSSTKMPGVINSVSKVDKEFWLHSSELSTTADYQKSISNQNITSIAKDNEGNLWYSSLKNGILFSPKHTNTVILKPKYIKPGDFITCISQQGNYIVEGTSLGDLFLKKTNQIEVVKKVPLAQTRGGIFSIFKLGGTKFFIASLSNFYIIDAATGSINAYFSINAIKNFAICNNISFLASNENLSLMPMYKNAKPQTADWQTINQLFNIPKQKQTDQLNFNQRIKTVCYDSLNHTLYINFTSALFSINKNGVKQIMYQNRPVNATSLIYANGKIYVGTLVNGLLVLNNGLIIKEFTPKEGLSSNTVIKLRLCNNRIWLLNSGNIQVLDALNDKLLTNIPLPVLLGSFVYDVAEINNEAYLTTAEGIYKIQINSYTNNARPINYLSFVVANQTDTLPINSGFIANEKTKSVEFTTVALWYNNPQSVYFKYRLLGANNENWQTAPNTQRNFSFTGLSAGSYIFQALAINGMGVVASSPIMYSFSIKKPWWQQWWLYLIIVAVIIDIVYLAVQERIDTIKKRNNLLVETIQLQSEVRNSMLTAIKSQMNPHFIFNALNTIQSFIYSNNKSKANSYLGKFSNLIRIVLDSSNKKAISLTEEVETLQLYVDLEVMRFENTLQAIIHVDPLLDTDSIFIPPMLVQPFVENAIKHGLLHKINNRKLKISFKPSANQQALEIEIDDNGIGRERSAFLNAQKKEDHNSFAIKANQTRIDILNQLSTNKIVLEIIDKKDIDNIAKGTTVKLFIPNEFLV
jgi:sensor histidine kinase YesM